MTLSETELGASRLPAFLNVRPFIGGNKLPDTLSTSPSDAKKTDIKISAMFTRFSIYIVYILYRYIVLGLCGGEQKYKTPGLVKKKKSLGSVKSVRCMLWGSSMSVQNFQCGP